MRQAVQQAVAVVMTAIQLQHIFTRPRKQEEKTTVFRLMLYMRQVTVITADSRL